MKKSTMAIINSCIILFLFVANSSADEYTTLLVRSNGTSFYDESCSEHTITTFGNTTSSNELYNYEAAKFDNDHDWLGIDDHDDFSFGEDDFTIDTWVRFNNFSSNHPIITQWDPDYEWYSHWNYWVLHVHPTLGLRFGTHPENTSYFILQQGSLNGWVAKKWYHVALVRNGSSWKLYRNGEVLASTTNGYIADPPGELRIGAFYADAGSNSYLDGKIAEMRISTGFARWTSAFTPSIGAYPEESCE